MVIRIIIWTQVSGFRSGSGSRKFLKDFVMKCLRGGEWPNGGYLDHDLDPVVF